MYTKPYRSVAEQLELLISRGLDVTEKEAARNCLARIGYYRLSAYWYPLRQRRTSEDTSPLREGLVLDDFIPGATFQRIMDLYVFDKQLRLLFLDALERVEVALRVDIALLLGTRDAWAHREAAHLHGNFAERPDPKSRKVKHREWLAKLDRKFELSDEQFAVHFRQKYPGAFPPIWIAIELWDFGMLSVFIGGMKHADQEQLAAKYSLGRPELLTSWVRGFNHIRNICAHHSRLWNKSPVDQIAPPRTGEIAILDHLAQDAKALVRVYAPAAALQFLLRTIHPTSSWAQRLRLHCTSFPASDQINLGQAGFPANWSSLDLWNQPSI